MIKLGALRAAGEVLWREAKSKPVAREPRKHVEVDVEDLLHCRLAVRQEEIDPFATHAALTNRRGRTLPDTHHVGGCLGIDIREECGVLNRDDENVTWIYRSDIHERGDAIISKNETAGNVACEDAAEDTVSHEFTEHSAV